MAVLCQPGKRLLTGGYDEPPESHEFVGLVVDVPTTTLTEVEPMIYKPMQLGSVRERAPGGIVGAA